jgi:predicted nucleic acid-binding protein
MNKIVLLDAGPLGMISHPRKNPEIKIWIDRLIRSGANVVISEISDYEVRRELIRADKIKGIERLNILKTLLTYLPITTDVMLKAAEFWAQARTCGQPTADNKALDADVILAAQALTLKQKGRKDVVIATTNVGHLSRFAPAEIWNEIS